MATLRKHQPICRERGRRPVAGTAKRGQTRADLCLDRLAEGPLETHLIPDFLCPSDRSRTYKSIAFRLPSKPSAALQSFAEADVGTEFSVLAAAVALVIHCYTEYESGTDVKRLVLAVPPVAAANARPSSKVALVVLDIEPDLALSAYRDRVASSIREASRAGAMPLAGLHEALTRRGEADRWPLFDAVVSHEGIHGANADRLIDADLSFVFCIGNDCLQARLRYRCERVAADTARRLAAHLGQALRLLLCDGNEPISRVSLTSPAERRSLIRLSKGERRPYPLEKPVQVLFEEQAQRSPDRIAVKDSARQLSYRELNEAANEMAHFLIDLGVRPREFVAILHERGVSDLICKLAALKCGAAFVPIDPGYPPDRVAYMLKDSAARHLLSDGASLRRHAGAVRQCQPRPVVVRSDRAGSDAPLIEDPTVAVYDRSRFETCRKDNPTVGAAGRDACYMIYTSGSTGAPKGAIVRHDGAVNHIYAQFDVLGAKPDLAMLQTAPASSDISIWQYLGPILIGGRTVVVDSAVLLDAQALLDVIRCERASIVEFVPVVLRTLLDHVSALSPALRELPGLEWMMVTGEAVPVDLVNRWLSLYPSIRIVNAYGPSEASDDVVELFVDRPLPPYRRSVPIGRPLPNCDAYILDRELRLAPPGAPGEICVAGICVGEGYWSKPEWTASVFLPDPFAPRGTQTLYRTGDLGRWLPDGNIEFLGRLDQQVKIRGHRIELEEIEAVLREHRAVADAAVRVWEDGRGVKRLVAYVVVDAKSRAMPRALRRILLERMPEHMVPAVFMPIECLPLTPSGKIDRGALPLPQDRLFASARSMRHRPRTAVEGCLARIWAEALQLRNVGVEDNFFELGGDSILGIQVANRARDAGLVVQPAQIFSHPTLRQLARVVESAAVSAAESTATCRSGSGRAERASAFEKHGDRGVAAFALSRLDADKIAALEAKFNGVDDVYPLSPVQQGIYIQCLLAGGSGAYVEQTHMDLCGDLDSSALLRAWQVVTAKHPALRTGFCRKGLPKPLQVVAKNVAAELRSFDWRHFPSRTHQQYWRQFLEADRTTAFALDRPPLHRLTLVRLGKERHRLLLTYHHLILDGWSEAIVLRELLLSYCDVQQGLPVDLTVERSYRDYATWLARQDESAAETFWRRKLEGFSRPARLTVEAEKQARGPKEFAWRTARLTERTSRDLRTFGRHHRFTLNSVLQAAWALALGHYAETSDVVYATVVSGRQAPIAGIESMVGLLVNTLPVRVRVGPRRSLPKLIRQLQSELVAIQLFGHLTLSRIQSLSDVPRERLPLAHSLFSFANYPDTTVFGAQLAQPRVENVELITAPDFPLTCFAVPDQGVLLQLVYDTGCFDRGNVTDILLLYAEILDAIPNHEAGTVAGLFETVRRRRRPARAPRCLELMDSNSLSQA